jgi:hypothetical protein
MRLNMSTIHVCRYEATTPYAYACAYAGLTKEALEPFLFDEESEKQLTTYEKWAVVRNAAEQVLQVYANRANAQWIETEEWSSPEVLNANNGCASSAWLRFVSEQQLERSW